MSALTAGVNRARRGAPSNGSFGYSVAAGEKIWRGGVVGINATFALQRPQTAGTVALVGIADRDLDNSGSATVSDIKVEALKGIYQIDVAAVAGANVNATVYATDDGTLTLTQSGSLLAAGTVAGVEGGKTWVKMVGG